MYDHVFNSIAASIIKSMFHICTYLCYICMYVYSPANISVLPVMHFCENTLALLVLQSQRVLEGQVSGMGSAWHELYYSQ